MKTAIDILLSPLLAISIVLVSILASAVTLVGVAYEIIADRLKGEHK